MSNYDEMMAKALVQETEFLEEDGAIKNEHGVYVYRSACGNHILSLDMFLLHYKQWLIENRYVKEID